MPTHSNLNTPVERQISSLEKVLTKSRSQSRTLSTASSNESLRTSELDVYLQESPAPIDVNPLQWWQKRTKTLPNLSRLAFSYLAIPATSVATEQLNSQGRLLITQLRSRLSAEVVRASVCIKAWQRLFDSLDGLEESEDNPDVEDADADWEMEPSEDDNDFLEDVL